MNHTKAKYWGKESRKNERLRKWRKSERITESKSKRIKKAERKDQEQEKEWERVKKEQKKERNKKERATDRLNSVRFNSHRFWRVLNLFTYSQRHMKCHCNSQMNKSGHTGVQNTERFLSPQTPLPLRTLPQNKAAVIIFTCFTPDQHEKNALFYFMLDLS